VDSGVDQLRLFEGASDAGVLKEELPLWAKSRQGGAAAPTVVDLFCGCGGLSLGFQNAGYRVLAGVDNDAPSLATYAANLPGAKALNCNLFDPADIERIVHSACEGRPPSHDDSVPLVDVVAAGPPCQGFSLTGPRNVDDARNGLYLAVLETVRRLRPQAFLIENVKGMKTLYGGAVKDEIVARFRRLGYHLPEPQILCAADYGVPQLRERLFFVGVRKELGAFEFPPPVCSPSRYVTCEEAIGDLPALQSELGEEEARYTREAATPFQIEMRRGTFVLLNHVATRHTEHVRSIIRQVPEGQNYRALPKGVGESRRFNEAWTRYHSQKPSRTIDTGHRNHFHYRWDRVPTIRENARLQSFPDWFRFIGTRTQQNQQVGNAVPPMLTCHLALQIRRHLVLG